MRSALVAIVGVMLAACQHSDVSRAVGARCHGEAECDDRCLVPSGAYPDGFCTLACNSRGDCPSDTTCADREGGVCLFECSTDPECGFLGAGWLCQAADLRGGGIKVMVCRGG
jgi:hypothetical protein